MKEFGADSPYTCLVTNLEGVDPDEVFLIFLMKREVLFLRLLEETVSRKSLTDL